MRISNHEKTSNSPFDFLEKSDRNIENKREKRREMLYLREVAAKDCWWPWK